MFRRKPKEPLLPPEWLIVGLGNPGPQYSGTRHNIGFDIVDALASAHKIKLSERKHRAVFGSGMVNGTSVVLAKPMTFMNLSGQAVVVLLREFGLKPDKVLVIADDLDLAVGRMRIRTKGSAGGHNGHKSLIQSLGTEEYPRLKMGIGKGDVTIDHVLNKFHPEERKDIQDAIKRACSAVECVVEHGVVAAMNQFNAG